MRAIPALPSTLPGPGETYLELDPDGTLSALIVSPSANESRAAVNVAFDWSRLFAEARLDPARFSSVESPSALPVSADTRVAWSGPAPDGSGVTLQIEAAARAGRPVYFRIIAPWTQPQASAGPAVGHALLNLLFLVILGVAALLARRNLQHGRSDHRGATRVAATVGLTLLAAQLLEAHHTFGAEVFIVIGALSWALFLAMSTWLLYVALEPYVRRHWPQALIAWTRLLAGRWRDRRVGRDLLIGAVAGLATVVLDRSSIWLAGWRTGDSVLWRVDWEALSSVGGMAATFLRSIAMSTAFPIDILFLLMLVRLLSGRTWLAVLIATALPVALNARFLMDPVLQLPLLMLSASVPVLMLTRYGLLAGAATMFMDAMAASVIVSLDLSSFFGRTMLVGLLLFAAPALVGFYITIAGRSLVARRFELSET